MRIAPESTTVLAELQTEIEQLRSTKNCLLRQVAEVEAALRRAEIRYGKLINQNTPISSIPNEILSMIFKIGQAIFRSNLQDDDDSEPEEHEPPFEVLVSHVSTHWRDVAINTHLLWRFIDISPGRSMAGVASYIARSNGCPLDVRLDLSQSVWNPKGVATEVLDMIISHLGRWHRFSVQSDREGADNPMLARLSDLSAPLLQHLSLCVDDLEHPDSTSDDNLRPQIFSGGAPNLSFVRLRGLGMHFFRPPLVAVTTLHLDQTKTLPIRYTLFRELLTASPFLTNLSIYGDIIGSDSWTSIESSAIEMPALRSLRICGLSGFVYCGILLGITAPRLESLVLKDVQEHDLDLFWTSSQMSKFPLLHSLTFCDFEFSEYTYRNMFRAFTAITKFTSLYSSVNTPMVLRLLGASTVNPNSSVLELPWPNLETLTLLLNLDDEPLVDDVVETRIIAGHPLIKLRLGSSYDLSLMHRFPWLRERVQVERFRRLDLWPDGLDYPDLDDVLFFDCF
jgi:hypothetical protein